MMHNEDTMLALAGSVVERTRDLIDEGWVKGQMNKTTSEGAPTHFCIEGALYLAAEETFGLVPKTTRIMVLPPAAHEAMNIARSFILDEVEDQLGRKYGVIPAYNDAVDRTHEQVLSVLDNAARRLWNLSVEQDELDTTVDLSRYTQNETHTAAKQYLYAVLA